MTKRMLCSVGAVSCWLWLASSALWAGEPLEAIKRSTDQVMEILKDPSLKENSELRDQRLWDVVAQRFDFEEMAKRALAVHWKDRSPQEQREFVDLFGKLLHKSYSGKLAQYSDERVEFLGEEIEGNRAEVRTKIISKGTEIPIDYKMHRRSEDWRVYDVVIEGVSLVNNYRNQFHRIVVSSGYKELIRRMRTKWDELIRESDRKKEPT